MRPHEFWQEIYPPGTFPPTKQFTDDYPMALPDGRQILLPIRPLPDGQHAVASLIVNQADFAVQAALAGELARLLAPVQPEMIVGLPTLGLTLAAAVAESLGHRRYVPLGSSRKFWYDDELSVGLSSITTPGGSKRLYLDPRLLPLLQDRRVVLIDDVISTGSSIVAALDLLAKAGIAPVAIGAAMLQSDRWRDALSDWQHQVSGVSLTPLFKREGAAWLPIS